MPRQVDGLWQYCPELGPGRSSVRPEVVRRGNALYATWDTFTLLDGAMLHPLNEMALVMGRGAGCAALHSAGPKVEVMLRIVRSQGAGPALTRRGRSCRS